MIRKSGVIIFRSNVHISDLTTGGFEKHAQAVQIDSQVTGIKYILESMTVAM